MRSQIFVFWALYTCTTLIWFSDSCSESYTCERTCYRAETYHTACGFQWQDTCEAYRAVAYTCPGTCYRCCHGYTGSSCTTPLCFGSNQCANGGTCIGVDNCVCVGGFASPNCTDIDECVSETPVCDHTCTNIIGSYVCTCDNGYVLGADGTSCIDVDECVSETPGCSHTCTNTIGSYVCSCDNGYVLGTDGTSCVDVDECVSETPVCSHTCTNIIGSYECTCDNGYALVTDGTCVDIDECLSLTSDCNHICVNTIGSYVCSCSNGYVLSDDGTSCVDLKCPLDTDFMGTLWQTSLPGSVSVKPCPEDYSGTVERVCLDNGTFQQPVYSCTKQDIQASVSKLKSCLVNTNNCSGKNITAALRELENKTEPVAAAQTGDLGLAENEIKLVVSVLDLISANASEMRVNSTGDTDAVLSIANNLLNKENTKSWKTLIQKEKYGAENVIQSVDKYIENILHVNQSQEVHFSGTNLVAIVRPIWNCSSGLLFPVGSEVTPPWLHGKAFKMFLGCQEGIGNAYSGLIYRNTSQMVAISHVGEERNSSKRTAVYPSTDFQHNDRGDPEFEIGSSIMSFTVASVQRKKLDPKMKLTFDTFDEVESSQIKCVFLKTTEGYRHWSTEGCRLVTVDKRTVECECDHLTNFAVLVSPVNTGSSLAITILSYTGCAVSLISVVITLAVHVIYWRSLRSPRTVILMHICTAIFLAYLLFASAATTTSPKDICTAVAVILHYLFLVLFFLMLAEGVYLGSKVMFPYKTDDVKAVIAAAWGIPALIVAISAGITSLHGYGNDRFCWLSIESSLIWAFFGPVLFVVVINAVIIGIVLCMMFRTNALKRKSERQKVLTGVRSICVMLPVTGVTWVMGLLTLADDDTAVFQYLFVSFNSLQGLFIFIFHCLLNKQVRVVVLTSYRRLSVRRGTTESSAKLREISSETKRRTEETDTNPASFSNPGLSSSSGTLK